MESAKHNKELTEVGKGTPMGNLMRRYWQPVALVDEFQDTNRLQSRIIDLLASEHQIMAVGDDAQCIYTWRGADWENIVAFPNRHPGTLIHTIDTNYRSTPEILAFANEILSHRPRLEGVDAHT